jgi:hypothetical protein
LTADKQENQHNQENHDNNIIKGGVIPVKFATDRAINDMVGNDDTMDTSGGNITTGCLEFILVIVRLIDGLV